MEETNRTLPEKPKMTRSQWNLYHFPLLLTPFYPAVRNEKQRAVLYNLILYAIDIAIIIGLCVINLNGLLDNIEKVAGPLFDMTSDKMHWTLFARMLLTLSIALALHLVCGTVWGIRCYIKTGQLFPSEYYKNVEIVDSAN